MNETSALNLAWWNERAGYHLHTPFYQKYVHRLASGDHCLLPLEERELGDLAGLDVLHLQCHVGTDTLSLSRLGAKVTGVDFSPKAIQVARGLANQLHIEADFVVASVDEFGAKLADRFDLVFTSYGVLSWLPDLNIWAQNIAQSLRSGGRFYIAEMHPLAFALGDRLPGPGEALELRYPYLESPEALQFDEPGSYADRERATKHNLSQEWSWSLGDVTNALVRAGLRIQWLREHAEGFCPMEVGLEESDDRHFRLPAHLHGKYPLTFSLMARKGTD